jgi:type II secretion system protein G
MKRGFTLIEIMIVIAVMAILIGIALPHFKGMQDEGNTAKAAGELRTLATAIESYYIHNHKAYPSQRTSGAQTAWQSALTGSSPKIVTIALTDPFDPSKEYSYLTNASSGSTYYVAFSVGPDGTGDITAIDANGTLTGSGDDIYISNGTSGTGGF